MDDDEITDKDVTRIGKLASRSFLNIKFFAYLVLGLLLALTALLGVGSAAVSLWRDVQENINAASLVLTIDRLLFVLMVVEIPNTVRWHAGVRTVSDRWADRVDTARLGNHT